MRAICPEFKTGFMDGFDAGRHTAVMPFVIKKCFALRGKI